MKRIDKTGERFGKLVIVETLFGYNNRKRATYRCLCDCGNEVFVYSGSISKTNSCGCYRYVDHTGKIFGKLTVVEMLYRYKNDVTYCKCICECGNMNYIVRSDALITGNTKSCGCIHSPSLLNQKFGRLIVVEEATSNTCQRLWKCICECGQVRFINSYTLTSGHTKSCGCIKSENVSTIETYIADILSENNIEYISEMSFDDCIGCNNWKLRFDFYIPNNNTLIEYDGKQHFEPIKYFGGEKSFEILQINDKIKNKYCEDNKINLIRLPYTLSNTEIKEIIIKNLKMFENPVTTTVA